jgi:hypothetical protein
MMALEVHITELQRKWDYSGGHMKNLAVLAHIRIADAAYQLCATWNMVYNFTWKVRDIKGMKVHVKTQKFAVKPLFIAITTQKCWQTRLVHTRLLLLIT